MIRYQQLFSVSLLHSYFLNLGAVVHQALDDDRREGLRKQFSVQNIFTIFPTDDSAKVLAGQRMLFKPTSQGFLVGVQAREVGPAAYQPFVPLDGEFRLRFALNLNDKNFANYTNLPARQGGLYHFSNRLGNPAPGNFLSRAVADYDEDKSYQAGELYLHNVAPGQGLFCAIRDTGPAATPVAADWERIPQDTYDPLTTYAVGSIVLADDEIYRAVVDSPGTDLTDNSQWQLLGRLPHQHITASDYLPLYSNRLQMDIQTAGIAQAFVSLFPLGDSQPIHQEQFIGDTNLEEIVLDLQNLRPGPYHLEVADSSHTVLPDLQYDFYLDPHAVQQNWFAVIEIDLGSTSFALLDGGGNIANPTYNLNFLNRSTRWRYIFPNPQTIGTGAQVVQEDSAGQVLVTSAPLPLTLFGNGIPLQTDSAATPSVSEEVLLPEPKVNLIRHQTRQWFSEIHLSNLPL